MNSQANQYTNLLFLTKFCSITITMTLIWTTQQIFFKRWEDALKKQSQQQNWAKLPLTILWAESQIRRKRIGICAICCRVNKAEYSALDASRRRLREGVTDLRTDGRTDQRADKASYRVACPQLKTRPDTRQSSGGRLGRSSTAKTARNSKMWRTDLPTYRPTDRHGKV